MLFFFRPDGGHYKNGTIARDENALDTIVFALQVRLRLLEKLYRLLSTGGMLYVEVPIPTVDFTTAPTEGDSVTEWTVIQETLSWIERTSENDSIRVYLNSNGAPSIIFIRKDGSSYRQDPFVHIREIAGITIENARRIFRI